MKANRKRTVILLALIGVALIGWDIWVAFFNEEKGDTISSVVHYYGTRSWFILVGIGVLLGHFFWPLKDKAEGDDRGGPGK